MLELRDISIRQGAFQLAGISLTLARGEYGVLMGRTGCGKTSLLEVVCGLRRPTGGSVHLADADVTQLGPAARGIGYVPQDRALFPTLTVAEHLAFAPRLRKQPLDQIAQRVRSLADELQITHLLARRPALLSGGEAQRVALGRALAMQPAVLLLDEPLGGLDEATRGEMYDVLARVHCHWGMTVLHVTHSSDEAQRLAGRRFVLDAGTLREQPLPPSNP